MPSISSLLADLPDRDLVATVARLAARERDATVELVAALAELDARKLYLEDGCASLFTYCTRRLLLSESAAYHRITAARAAQRFPAILGRLREGALTLTAVGLLAPHLTDANLLAVLDAARHQGKRAVEELVARLQPRPDLASSIRKLPSPRATAGDRSEPVRVTGVADRAADDLLARAVPAGADGCCPIALLQSPLSEEPGKESAGTQGDPSTWLSVVPSEPKDRRAVISTPHRPAVVRPLSPSRYQVQLTVSAETHAKLRRAQDLLRHTIPNGDPAAVLDRALTVLLQQLERTKCAATVPSLHVKTRKSAPRRRTRVATVAPPPTATAGRSSGTPEANTGRPSSRSTATRSTRHRRARAIPAAVRRAVWARDDGRCSYVGTSGRCMERSFLEFHHRIPFAAGGESTIENLTVVCRAHNSHLAERDFPVDAEAFDLSAGGERLPLHGPATASGGS